MTRYITEGRVSYFSMVLFYGVHDLCNVQGGFIGCPTTSHNSWLQPVMVAFFQPCLAFPSPFSAFQFAHWEWIFGGDHYPHSMRVSPSIAFLLHRKSSQKWRFCGFWQRLGTVGFTSTGIYTKFHVTLDTIYIQEI